MLCTDFRRWSNVRLLGDGVIETRNLIVSMHIVGKEVVLRGVRRPYGRRDDIVLGGSVEEGKKLEWFETQIVT